MSDIVDIPKSTACDNVGGVYLAYATEYDNITGVTIDGTAKHITNFTMGTTGQWGKLEFDDENNVAFFNEEGSEEGSRVLVNGTGLMKFNGITQAKIVAANKAKSCCGLVIIWFHYDGTARVQGIDINPSAGTWKFSKKLPRIVPNVLSDTGENAARIEYNVTSQAQQFASTTDLTTTEIEAL